MTAFKMKKEGDKLVEEKLWSNTDNSVGFNTPVLKNGLMFGLSSGDQLFCINTETKKTAWSAPFTQSGRCRAKTPPRAGVASIAATPRAGHVCAVRAARRKGPARRASARRIGSRPAPRRRSGRTGPGGFGRGFGGRGRGGGMGGRGYGSIVDVGSALVALTPAGELVVFQPAGEAFTELARYKVAERGTYAYPIPAGTRHLRQRPRRADAVDGRVDACDVRTGTAL